MFSDLVVCYLYLGGAGAAMVALASAADLLCGRAARTGSPALAWTRTLDTRFFARAHVGAFAALALGALCLVADLGRPERFFYVLAYPTPSLLTFGSAVLGLSLACSAYLGCVASFGLARAPLWSVRLTEALGIAAGSATTVYTGALLAQIDAVALWNFALVPLFACSSCSLGTAGLLGCLFPFEGPARRAFGTLAKASLALTVLEAACFALWAAVAGGGDPGILTNLLFGKSALALWAGFVAPSLAAPAVLGVTHVLTKARNPVVWSLPCIFVGGFFLRYYIVNAPFL